MRDESDEGRREITYTDSGDQMLVIIRDTCLARARFLGKHPSRYTLPALQQFPVQPPIVGLHGLDQ